MPSGRIGADLDDMFEAADEAGGTLTSAIYDEHWYDGVPVLRQAQKRYRARCAAAAAAEAAAADEAAAPPAKRRKPVPPVTARTGVSTQTPARSTKHQTQVRAAATSRSARLTRPRPLRRAGGQAAAQGLHAPGHCGEARREAVAAQPAPHHCHRAARVAHGGQEGGRVAKEGVVGRGCGLQKYNVRSYCM